MGELDANDLRIHIAGPPYVVEMLRRSLAHDFRYFSLTAFVLFGLTMAALFRSLRVFLGMIFTCTNAVLLTLLLQSLLGLKIGILTVNLGTLVFIIALSHLFYMTFNWQTLARRGETKVVNLGAAACRMTFPASFWSLICASLGFGSLLIVQAKPLRELGFGGVLGTIVAFVCAYLMYPPFLRWAVPHTTKLVEKEPSRAFLSRRFGLVSLGIILLSIAQRAGKKGWDAWVAGRKEQWRGIVYSDVIFAAGFAIFTLSDFPPTQRFGLVILAGLIIDILANLFVLPLLGGAQWQHKYQRASSRSRQHHGQ